MTDTKEHQAVKLRDYFDVTARRPAYAQAVRGALVWLSFMVAGSLTGNLLLGIQAGFVGWLTSFCDDATGLVRRFIGAAVLTVSIAVATVVAAVSGNTVLGSVIVTAVFGTIACLASVSGPGGAKKGMVAMFLILFTVGAPTGWTVAFQLGLASIAGGIATMLLMLLMLPSGRSTSQLLTAGRYFDQASAMLRLYGAGADDAEITKGRTQLVEAGQEAFRDARFSWVGGTRDLLMDYLTRASAIARDAVTFADVRAMTGRPLTPVSRKMFTELSLLCDRVAGALNAPGLRSIELAPALAAIDAVDAEINAGDEATGVGMGALLDMRHNVHDLLNPPVQPGDSGYRRWQVRYGPSFWDSLTSDLRPGTPLFRHTTRYVVLLTLATLFYKIFNVPDGFFIAIGVNIMLQPDLGGSVSRLRVFSLGTIVGSIIGAVLGVALDDYPVAMAAVTACVIFAVLAYTPVTWWVFAAGASIFIVAVLGVLVRGGWYLAGWRIADTIIAAVIVFLGMFALWPSRAKKLVPTDVGLCLFAIADFIGVLDKGSAGREDSRRQVVRLTGELGHRIIEYSHEPGHSAVTLARYEMVLASVRQMYGLVTEMAQLKTAGKPTMTTTTSPDRVITLVRAVADGYENNVRPAQLPQLVSRSSASQPIRDAGDIAHSYESELRAVGVIGEYLAGQLPLTRAGTDFASQTP